MASELVSLRGLLCHTGPHITISGFHSIGKPKRCSFFFSPSRNSRHVPPSKYTVRRAILNLSPSPRQGSTQVYKSYLEPFLIQNEKDIDASIASARDETVQFIHSRLSALWDIFYSLLSKTPITQQPSPSARDAPTNMSPQKALQSIQSLLGVATPPSFLAPSVQRSRPAAEDSSAQAHSSGVTVPAGYDVGETATN